MLYIEEIFYIIFVFLLAYLIFKNDIANFIGNSGIIEKDYTSCYILKYPKHAELHNKNQVYKIDFDEFFELNPKLKGKIKIIEREEIDATNVSAIKKEVEERKKIKQEFNEKNFWEERNKIKNRIASK